MAKKDRGPIEDDGTKAGYYRARREQRLGITPSDEEVERRRRERIPREAESRRRQEQDRDR